VRGEMRLASDCWTRHRLKHLSWRSRWIMMNYPVHIWTENSSFMRNLTVPFCLVLLTDHKMLHCYALNAVCLCLVVGQLLYPSCRFFSATVCASKFPTLVGQFTQQPSWTILLWQIEIFNQNRKFLRNFYGFVYFLMLFRSWQFPKVK